MPGRRKKRKRAPKRAPTPVPANEFDVWKASLTPREQRIDEVLRMMSQGQWMTGVSHRQLAEKWGMHPDTVAAIAAEANRLLRRTFREDKDGRAEARAAILQTFEVVRVRGMLGGSAPHLRVALDATECLGRYLGLEPPKRLEVGQPDEFEGLTDEQLRDVADGKDGGGKGEWNSDDDSREPAG